MNDIVVNLVFKSFSQHSTVHLDPSPSPILSAFAADTTPIGEAVKELLKDPTPEAAKDLLDRLPSLLPDDPAMAAVLAEAMAAEFGDQIVKNKTGECQSDDPAHCRVHGVPEAQKEKPHTAATPDQVKKFLDNLPDKISKEDFDSLLTAGFTDKDGAGNEVKYGKLLRDHIEDPSRNPKDQAIRQSQLGKATRMIRETKPMQSHDKNRPNEKIYTGFVGSKAFIAIADEHNEINALEIVSYRRNRKNDK